VKKLDKRIIKEYAILYTFYQNLEFENVDSEPPQWVVQLYRLKNKVGNVLRIYADRYAELARLHFMKSYKGIDEKSRYGEYILPIFALTILELYKVDFNNKKIGRGITNVDELFDIIGETIEDVKRHYGHYPKKDIDRTIDFAYKLYYKLLE